MPKETVQLLPAPMYPAMQGPRKGPIRKVVPLVVLLDWGFFFIVRRAYDYQMLIICGQSRDVSDCPQYLEKHEAHL